MKTATTCKSTTKGGERCQAPAIDGSSFCFFHDPDLADERQRAQSSGGRNGATRTLPPSTPDLSVASSRDVVDLLSDTINQVRRGAIDPRVGNAVGYLANILLKAFEQGDIEDRVRALEAATNSRP